jgi:hypothetical protein
VTTSATPAFGIAAFRGPARLVAVESEGKREARLRRLGRLSDLRPESLTVYLGPGVQKAGLWSRLFGCKTIVVDSDPVALAALARDAEQLGVSDLVAIQELDPLSAKQPEISPPAELIFAQGLASAVGFDAALEAMRPLLVTDGLLAVFQRAWITPNVPDEVRRYWEAHTVGPIRTIKETMERTTQLGFEPMTCELVPAQAWDEHFERVEAQLSALSANGGSETEIGKALARLHEEQKIHQAGGRGSTSLGCFVGRRVEPNSPPRWPRRGFGE